MIGLSISLVARLRSGVSAYMAGGFEPAIVYDYTANYFRKNNVSVAHDDLLTHTATTNGTVTDSDGSLKHRAHNVVTHSEDFTNAAWSKTNVTVAADTVTAPDGTLTADTITDDATSGVHLVGQTSVSDSANKRTNAVFVKAGTARYLTIAARLPNNSNVQWNNVFDTTDGVFTLEGTQVSGFSVEDAGGGWWGISYNDSTSSTAYDNLYIGFANGPALTDIVYVGTGSTLHVWGAHVYRSDLGGMQDNPDNTVTGLESYVPTGASPVYKRRNNYTYNGTAWVGPRCLKEPAAATNLMLNSGTLATQNVTVTAVPNTLHFTGTGTVTLTGASTAGPLVGTGAGEENRTSLTFTPSAGTLTCTVSGTVTNAQLEVGSVPSSYMPTAGATATRALETLIIPAANLASVVNTTAMSIHLKGTMSYADTANTKEVETYKWEQDASNTIYAHVDTSSTRTGQPKFIQEVGGTYDPVQGTSSYYTPGIDVAFNIAARHGGTFVNGALAGVALTVNSTPITLVDLTAEDFQIAPTGIHNIEQGSIWGEDIADAGIEEAST